MRQRPFARAHRARGPPRVRRPHPRARPPAGELRDRRLRPERGEPAPRGEHPGDRRRATSSSATSAGRWTGTARTSRGCSWSASRRAEVRDVYTLLVDAQEQAVQAATVGTSCEEVDAAARRRDHRGRARRALHPPHRPRHRARSARGAVPRVGQPGAARARSRVQHRARHLLPRAGSACGSRTSSSRRRTAPTGSTQHPATSRSSADRPSREPRSRHGPAAVGDGRPRSSSGGPRAARSSASGTAGCCAASTA